jgi:hypothetical protein
MTANIVMNMDKTMRMINVNAIAMMIIKLEMIKMIIRNIILRLSFVTGDSFFSVVTSSVFWDIKPCTPSKINACFEEHIASIFSLEE